MKYLLLLISLNCFAEKLIHITPLGEDKPTMYLEVGKDSTVKKELKKYIKRSKYYVGVWNEIEEDSILSRKIQDMDGKEVGKEYFHPTNYSISVEDISAQLAEKEAAKQARKDELNEIRLMLGTIKDSDLPAWHKKLLKRLVKELKD